MVYTTQSISIASEGILSESERTITFSLPITTETKVLNFDAELSIIE